MAGIICPQCKANNKENARFCAECGSELGTARSSRSVPPPTGKSADRAARRNRKVNPKRKIRRPQVKTRMRKRRLQRSGCCKTGTGSRNS